MTSSAAAAGTKLSLVKTVKLIVFLDVFILSLLLLSLFPGTIFLLFATLLSVTAQITDSVTISRDYLASFCHSALPPRSETARIRPRTGPNESVFLRDSVALSPKGRRSERASGPHHPCPGQSARPRAATAPRPAARDTIRGSPPANFPQLPWWEFQGFPSSHDPAPRLVRCSMPPGGSGVSQKLALSSRRRFSEVVTGRRSPR